MKIKPNAPCPCGSGARYKKCCRLFHTGDVPETAEALMRSRFSAYAAGVAEYIMDTTDPFGPQFEADAARWRASVEAFSRQTTFIALELLDTEPGRVPDEAFVTFRATMEQRGEDASFTERSRFTRRDGRWLYHSGEFPG